MRLISLIFARIFARFFDKNFKFFNHLKNKREIVAWSFYDFANQPFTTIIITFLFAPYFADVICSSEEINGIGLWSLGIAITGIFVAIISPIIGAISDTGGFRKYFFVLSTWLCIISTACLFFFKEGDVFSALVYVIIANIGFELGTVICNSYLSEISDRKNIGKISGFAWGLGFLGGLISLIIILTLMIFLPMIFTNVINIEFKIVRISAVIVALWFAIFSIPVFFLVREKKSEKLTKSHVKKSFNSILETFYQIKKYKKLVRFLIARLFYNDALITIFALGGAYAIETLNFTLIETLILGIVLNIFACIGSFLFGRLEDTYGPKWCIEISIITLFIAVLLAFFAPFFSNLLVGKSIFWFAGILIGIMTGPSQSCSRSLMARLTPFEKTNEFFGFYAFTGKATAFLGPFIFALLSVYSPQLGLLIVVLFFLIGYLIFKPLKLNNE
ncbi:MAG: MFS transporter [Flavobacteriales bacterium]|nr:MFS transporter [Flavobacteriales bacterium]